MISFEANLICDVGDCAEIITGDPFLDAKEAQRDVIKHARKLGWKVSATTATCPGCVAKEAKPEPR